MTMPRYRVWADNGVDSASLYSPADHAPKCVDQTEGKKSYQPEKGSRNEDHFEKVLPLQSYRKAIPVTPTQDGKGSEGLSSSPRMPV
jgi:hypothetical protein